MEKVNSVSIDKVFIYNLTKQHIAPTAKAQTIKQVAKNLIGLHSARLRTPYVTLYARLDEFSPSDLQKELYYSHSMIKLRCMRKTLHIVDLEVAPIVHQATLRYRLSEFNALYKSLFTPDLHRELREKIINLVCEMPLSSDEIVNSINCKNRRPNIAERNRTIKVVLRELWEDGTLCYIDESQNWGTEIRRYGLTTLMYPDLCLISVSESEAQEKLVEYHIEKFGPVTEEDISWWTGLGARKIRECLLKFEKRMVRLTLAGFDEIHYMFEEDFGNLLNFKVEKESWVSFLAYEDPTLKGYHKSRYRYIDSQNYHKLFNDIGEARSSIILNGRVIGLWEWNKRTEKISWFTFSRVESQFLQKIQSIAGIFEDFHKLVH